MDPMIRRTVAGVAVLIAAAVLPAAPAATSPAVPAVKHVFVIVLENESAQTTFGPGSAAPYLAHTLTAEGAYLPQYFATGHASLDNYISMVSGQAANPVTQADCQIYTDFVGLPMLNADGQATGQGCVYPKKVRTVANQLTTSGRAWKGYMEDMGTPCRHPKLNTRDKTQAAKVGDQYAARHNPFVYFHSIIDYSAACASHVVDLNQLTTDLGSVATTPALSFITPNLCHDGHDAPCVDGEPGGLESADLFLQTWVPRITGSKAFGKDGMLIILFDESDTGDSSACCGEKPGPNSPKPGIGGPGGGRTGAVVLSKFVRPGTVSTVAYNHYSLLRSIEDIFGLPHLGFAAANGLAPFGADVYTAP
jgi:hypothetical protein